MVIHSVFDVLAWLVAACAAFWIKPRLPDAAPLAPALRRDYWTALVVGAALGAYGFGSLNLWISGQPGVARSIEGAIAGAVLAVELYKRHAGVATRTGARFALPLALGVAVGRIGCFLSGLADFTHGVPTTSVFGYDFGDGVLRHPVQLYESAAMALFAGAYLVGLAQRCDWAVVNGFYFAMLFYGAQRFVWEFLKPYGCVLGPFTIFHILSLLLVVYGATMLATAQKSADETSP